MDPITTARRIISPRRCITDRTATGNASGFGTASDGAGRACACATDLAKLNKLTGYVDKLGVSHRGTPSFAYADLTISSCFRVPIQVRHQIFDKLVWPILTWN